MKIWELMKSALLGIGAASRVGATHNSISDFTKPHQQRHLQRTGNENMCPCAGQDTEVNTIRILAPGGGVNSHVSDRLRQRAPEFLERYGVNVEVIGVDELNQEIMADTVAKVYDAYFYLPVITGDIAEKGGLADLTEFVAGSKELDWTDIFRFNREQQAVYDGKVQFIPCDGDQFSMYYRKDLFDRYNQSVPRTWDEYTETAAFFHGMEVPASDGSGQNVTLNGSCIDRNSRCSELYHFNVLVHSSIVQAQGTLSAVMFDPQSFDPLLGDAFAETLRHLENQAKYGAPDEFDDDSCFLTNFRFTFGNCALTFFWGNIFSRHLLDGSVLDGKLGIAPVPGSTKVLDRSTGKLVTCDEESCPHGKTYPDIGRVNLAPYAAAGGWGGSVSNGVNTKRQELASEFLAFVCGREESLKDVITNSKVPSFTGADPYRKSQRDVEKWIEQGYPRETTLQYLDTITEQLNSPNTVLDARFPLAFELQAAVTSYVSPFLEESRESRKSEDERIALANKVESAWRNLTSEYDRTRTPSTLSLKEVYQRSYNVYQAPMIADSKSISTELVVGIGVGSFLIVALLLGTVYLVRKNRKIVGEQNLLMEKEMARRLAEREAMDDDDDDHSSVAAVSETKFAREQGRDEIQEINNLIQSETTKVSVWRWILALAFLSANVTGTVLAYVFVNRVEGYGNIKISPIGLAGAVFFVYTIPVFIFVLYDRAVRDRTAALTKNAAQANAVVTNIFPGHFRDGVIQGNDLKATDDLKCANEQDRAMEAYFPTDGGNAGGVEPGCLADLYLESTVLFADIVGFTAWSSAREPNQVLTLLEVVFSAFDEIAARRGVFKVETVGDCYVAVTGVPTARTDHALAMARFAVDIRKKMLVVTKDLEITLGPDTADLSLRIGMHSGPVTGGVLRGDRARFQLFGDTVNTTERIESSGMPGKIHVSEECAKILEGSGKGSWLTKRDTPVSAKGKGMLTTFWLSRKTGASSVGRNEDSSPNLSDSNGEEYGRVDRLVEWNVEVFIKLIKKIVVRRGPSTAMKTDSHGGLFVEAKPNASLLDEVREIISLPEYDSRYTSSLDPKHVEIPTVVVEQLRYYVSRIEAMYRSNSFHNFEHASHVVMSVNKMMSRVVAPSAIMGQRGDVDATLHDHTYGITSDPLTQFACAFSALIHDVDHRGIGNPDLILEEPELGTRYRKRSVAEQNSFDLSWSLLMEDSFQELRSFLFFGQEALERFRSLVVNSVMATDIMDKDMKSMRNQRWDRAFKSGISDAMSAESHVLNDRDAVNRKATIVIEHIIQASDVSHTMQHWHIYRKWNECLFVELYDAFRSGRSASNPADFWAQGEIGFFDGYIIPLAKKLKECAVFGKSGDEYLHYALHNRDEWQKKGPEIVAEMIENLNRENPGTSD